MNNIDRITHTTILCQVLNNYLQDDLANGFFKMSLKQSCRNFLNQLHDVELKQYDIFHALKEDSTVQVYDVMDNFFKELAEIHISDMENLSLIYKAYKKNPKSIEGITKKVLNL